MIEFDFKLERCKKDHPDCFALTKNKKCFCLQNTEFNGECPFYKNRNVVDQERKRNELSEFIKDMESDGFYLKGGERYDG